jgi:uncharacterized protein YprB with RNaseH-like and TPR domain
MNQHATGASIENAYRTETFVYFDLETIPCQDEAHLETLRQQVKAPGTYKKPESIQKWLDDNREDAAREAMAKTSFDGAYGHICTISWAKNGGDIKCAQAKSVADERDILSAFLDDLDDYHSETLVGHNIVGFDIPFIRKRAVALGVRMPHSIPRDPKPWDKSINDTMVMWAGSGSRISMNNLCGVLGIKGKDGFDGSMVAAAFAAGDFDRIAEYCRDDVWRTREIHKRFLAVGF